MATFSLAAVPSDRHQWLEIAQRAETIGFDSLLVPDHPGVAASPYVSLTAAAAVTSTIQLGAYVSNGGVREPMLLATDVATLDVISGGRARFGIGAGHTPAEWRAIGRERPDVPGRVRRCIAVAEAVRDLLAGDKVTVDTPELVMRDAELTEPRPVRQPVPLTMGTSNSRLLRWAGQHADIVGMSGLGRTREDGHTHEVRWRADQIEAQLEKVAEGAAGRETPPPLEALVQRFVVTDDAEAEVAELAERNGLGVEEVLAAPYVLVGTEEEILTKLTDLERRWGITRYVIRDNAIDQAAPIVARSHAEQGRTEQSH